MRSLLLTSCIIALSLGYEIRMKIESVDSFSLDDDATIADIEFKFNGKVTKPIGHAPDKYSTKEQVGNLLDDDVNTVWRGNVRLRDPEIFFTVDDQQRLGAYRVRTGQSTIENPEDWEISHKKDGGWDYLDRQTNDPLRNTGRGQWSPWFEVLTEEEQTTSLIVFIVVGIVGFLAFVGMYTWYQRRQAAIHRARQVQPGVASPQMVPPPQPQQYGQVPPPQPYGGQPIAQPYGGQPVAQPYGGQPVAQPIAQPYAQPPQYTMAEPVGAVQAQPVEYGQVPPSQPQKA
jgi:hypothetical protein